MKKTLLSIFATLVCSVSAIAGINTIVVTSEDETANIALDEKPVVTFDKGNLVIATEQSTLTYATDQIITFSFADVSGIRDLVASSKGNPTFFFDGSLLRVFNLAPCSMVSIYSLSGMTCYQRYADAQGNIEIDLDNYAANNSVLIVKTTDKSIKISKK